MEAAVEVLNESSCERVKMTSHGQNIQYKEAADIKCDFKEITKDFVIKIFDCMTHKHKGSLLFCVLKAI